MSDNLLRVYLDPDEIGTDGYPLAWHSTTISDGDRGTVLADALIPIKNQIRMEAAFRCERCGHPYPPEIAETCPRGEWTPCDEHCTHGGPRRWYVGGELHTDELWILPRPQFRDRQIQIEAKWRILTVHHLNGIKHDCRWWNLAALCQRCHLVIQGRVVMERVWPWEHSDWFKPHAAGWYAAAYLGEDLSREETMARLDELLDLERQVQ